MDGRKGNSMTPGELEDAIAHGIRRGLELFNDRSTLDVNLKPNNTRGESWMKSVLIQLIKIANKK